MHLVSCTNTHHDVIDLVNHEIVKNTKTWISWERNITVLRNKKILNLSLRWHILRSYRFVAEVTFKEPKLAKFYLLLKIHKRLHGVPDRPVISNYRFYTENISSFLDYYLQPLDQRVKSYIKDTNHFLNKIRGWIEGAILCTTDVVSLYCNTTRRRSCLFL